MSLDFLPSSDGRVMVVVPSLKPVEEDGLSHPKLVWRTCRQAVLDCNVPEEVTSVVLCTFKWNTLAVEHFVKRMKKMGIQDVYLVSSVDEVLEWAGSTISELCNRDFSSRNTPNGFLVVVRNLSKVKILLVAFEEEKFSTFLGDERIEWISAERIEEDGMSLYIPMRVSIIFINALTVTPVHSDFIERKFFFLPSQNVRVVRDSEAVRSWIERFCKTQRRLA